MRYVTYAAIVIGSRNILMRVYTVSGNGIKMIDSISHEYELGKDAYLTRHITAGQIEEICVVLSDFKLRLKEYAVKDCRCYATSAIRRAKNQMAVCNHIKIRTGFTVQVLSNSELRFLMYKGIQVSELNFDEIVQKNTAILDIGAGSVQVSLFDKQALYMTQNLAIGTAKVREILEFVEDNTLNYISVMEEYIESVIDSFKMAFLKDKQIKNVVAIGDEIKNLKRIAPELKLGDVVHYDQICYLYRKIKKASYKDLAVQYGLTIEEARMTLPSVIIYKLFLEESKADTVYICDTNLCDGSVIDYAQETGRLTISHDFYQDMIASAKYIGKRYRYNKQHAQYVRELSLDIFDRTAKFHGLKERDRLILELAAILHDIGKYVNMNDAGDNGYRLIMSTEIMGLSHREREQLANVVLYNTKDMPGTDEVDSAFWREEYLRIAKLSVILRLANALNRGQRQKYRNVSIMRKGKELLILVESDQDMTLEISRFGKKADYFNEIIGVTPVLKQKRPL